MQKTRNRLLIVLAFLTVVSATVWVDAGAEMSMRSSDPSGNSSSNTPPPSPSTGEPDGSGGPGCVIPPPPKFGLLPGDEETTAWQPWLRDLRMATAIWAARVFGVSLR
jgi:hypothetical protein